MRLLNIILVMLALVPSWGCRSERHVTSHEEAHWQRAVLDSAATHVDSTARRDSVSLWWAARGLSLEVDSVDWHFTWDSAGRVASVSGKRLVSRRSSSTGQKAATTAVEETHEESRRQRAVQDSTAVQSMEDKHAETRAGWLPGWLELLLTGVAGALVMAGGLHLVERWKSRK